ncbi:helix-turn-helix domain-containing protein [Dokdonella soli]|uniref:helix-turn-helix domain-containing protein n=1 Tax=Dokdonella soli TaxID=529810 RepID=UPI00360A62DA
MSTDHLLLRIGLVIRRHREAQKLTQEEFADANDINRTYYGAIERGTQNLTTLNLERIAASLDKRLSQLLREAENLDLDRARKRPPSPPRRGRPPGAKSRWR